MVDEGGESRSAQVPSRAEGLRPSAWVEGAQWSL